MEIAGAVRIDTALPDKRQPAFQGAVLAIKPVGGSSSCPFGRVQCPDVPRDKPRYFRALPRRPGVCEEQSAAEIKYQPSKTSVQRDQL